MQNTKIEKFFNILQGCKEPGYDVETGGLVPGDMTPLDWTKGYVCGYSVSDGVEAVYIPTRHEGGGNIDYIDNFEHNLRGVITNRSGRIVGHNIKFDAHFSQNHGIVLGAKVADTMIREALLNEYRFSYSLENVCKNYDVAQKKGKQLYEHIGGIFGLKPTRDTMGHYYRLRGDDPVAIEYAEGDTLSTKQLFDKQAKNIYEEQLEYIEDMEGKLSYVLQKMERRGIKIDPDQKLSVIKEVNDLYIEAFRKIPLNEKDLTPINTRSNKDLQAYFEMCGITDWPYTDPTQRFPEGSPSFTKAFLQTTDDGMLIIQARKLQTLKSLYLDQIDRFIKSDGKIHTSYNQTMGEFGGTKSGRLSNKDPNLQQVPKRDKFLGKIYRRMFVPDPGYILVELDYSQAEPRLYTHYSEEPTLMHGYWQTPFIDMHNIAAEFMGITRDVAKNLNLGMLYVMGVNKLAISLGISYEDARRIAAKWHRTFRRVSKFTRRAANVAEDRKYVKTILGRRARFPNPDWSYRAANRIIQGGSADILKYKMVELDNYLVKHGLEQDVQMLLTIHDSLVFQIRKCSDTQHWIDIIKSIMENTSIPPFNLKVPFVAEYLMGDDWAKASYK